eukprot:m.62414 g.62414  ORF g.62414 m.62414 type:complete len:57 (-) comp13388_c1_seq3:210-380(-)
MYAQAVVNGTVSVDKQFPHLTELPSTNNLSCLGTFAFFNIYCEQLLMVYSDAAGCC